MKILYLIKAGIVGFMIGYFTNWIALRMLFYPKKRIFGVQGLLPKYQNVFGDKTIDFIFKFIDFDDILAEAVNKKAFSSSISGTKWGFLRKRVGFIVADEIERWLEDKHIRKYVAKNLSELSPQAKVILAKRIANSNIDHLTNLILKSTSKEMHFLKIIGGIIGLTIAILHEILSQ